MRNVTFAVYNGSEYPAGIKSDGRIVLRSNNMSDIEKGFMEKTIGRDKIYVKYVQRNELEEIYHKRCYAVYKGFKFEIIDETSEQISIVTMVGDYRDWQRLGMQCIDKGVYQKWIHRNEVNIICEKNIIYSHP